MSAFIPTEPALGHIVIRAGGAILGETNRAIWLNEPGHAPRLYIPKEDMAMMFLEPSATTGECPRKGVASYYNIITKSQTIHDAAFSYESPLLAASEIAGMLSFYADKVLVEER